MLELKKRESKVLQFKKATANLKRKIKYQEVQVVVETVNCTWIPIVIYVLF